MFLKCMPLLAVLASALSFPKQQNYCYTSDENPYLLFSTITAYEYNHGELSQDEVPGTCTPVQFWAVNRHGTRYPDEKEIDGFKQLGGVLEEIVKNYAEGSTALCEGDFELLET